jgi:hypothetical protein
MADWETLERFTEVYTAGTSSSMRSFQASHVWLPEGAPYNLGLYQFVWVLRSFKGQGACLTGFYSGVVLTINTNEYPVKSHYIPSFVMVHIEKCHSLVGGFNHFLFPIIYIYIWDVILPIDELIFFKMVIAPPTRLLWYNIHYLWLV